MDEPGRCKLQSFTVAEEEETLRKVLVALCRPLTLTLTHQDVVDVAFDFAPGFFLL